MGLDSNMIEHTTSLSGKRENAGLDPKHLRLQETENAKKCNHVHCHLHDLHHSFSTLKLCSSLRTSACSGLMAP